jgi:hypothetical protein
VGRLHVGGDVLPRREIPLRVEQRPPHRGEAEKEGLSAVAQRDASHQHAAPIPFADLHAGSRLRVREFQGSVGQALEAHGLVGKGFRRDPVGPDLRRRRIRAPGGPPARHL